MAQLKLKENNIYSPISPDFTITVNQMPSVSASDNGKFAVVDNGQWVAKTIYQAESVSSYTQSEYLMTGTSFAALNSIANTKAGTSTNYTLAQIISILSEAE